MGAELHVASGACHREVSTTTAAAGAAEAAGQEGDSGFRQSNQVWTHIDDTH